MTGKQLLIETVQRGADSRRLSADIVAVGILLHHPLDQSMLEKDSYCNDILTQSAAVSAALNSFNKELLSSHIHTCVARDIREGRDEVIDELMVTIQKLMR